VSLGLAGLILMISVGLWWAWHRPHAISPAEESSGPGVSALAPGLSSDGPARTLSPPVPAAGVPPALKRTATAAASTPASDEELLRAIRAAVRVDPARAEALARQARELYPNSPSADERDSLLVDALINQQHIGAARSETYYYYDHHPHGTFAAHLFAMTGVHPAPPRPGPQAH